MGNRLHAGRGPRRRPRPYATLTDYMHDTGMTQVGLARLVQTTQATISRILRGQRVPKGELAVRLARITGVPIENLAREYYARQRVA